MMIRLKTVKIIAITVFIIHLKGCHVQLVASAYNFNRKKSYWFAICILSYGSTVLFAVGTNNIYIHHRTKNINKKLTCGSCFLRHQKVHSGDRKSTRLNSSHVKISYAVFCLKKKIIQLP